MKFDRWNCNVCGLSRKMTALNYVRLLEVWLPPSLSGPSVRPRPFTGPAPSLAPPLHWLPLHRLCSSAPPGMQQRRDPAGSRLTAAAAKLPTRLARRLRAADQGLQAAGQRLNRRAPAAAVDASGANAQFFHQPLTVSTAWAPRSVSAEWALTRPEDRRAAWKREATFSQFTRFHQALT